MKDKDHEDVKRFLASLRYPSMNERQNQISEIHEGTFDWIFGSLIGPFLIKATSGRDGLEGRTTPLESVISNLLITSLSVWLPPPCLCPYPRRAASIA